MYFYFCLSIYGCWCCSFTCYFFFFASTAARLSHKNHDTKLKFYFNLNKFIWFDLTKRILCFIRYQKQTTITKIHRISFIFISLVNIYLLVYFSQFRMQFLVLPAFTMQDFLKHLQNGYVSLMRLNWCSVIFI